MLDDIINNERDLLATLITIRDLTIEHNIFPLKGMIDQLNSLISRSEKAIDLMTNYNDNSNLGEE